MDQDKIGSFIKSIRQEHNLTQKQLADKLGVTYQAVSKWENGKNIPDIAIIKEISKEFNIDINELLEGEKQNKSKKNNIIIIILLTILLILAITIPIIIFSNKKDNFEFKTISSKCSDFKITGSAAYNQKKTAIYISSIEFCGKDNNETYKELSCILYETNKTTKKKISTCKKKNNLTLENYLKDLNINVNNYNSMCKYLTSNNLSLEINAINNDNKNIIYKIPIKLEDACKQG